MAFYCLRSPLHAILDKSPEEHVQVTIPAGAVVRTTERRSSTLIGMVGVYWEGRHYSIYPSELVQKAERVAGGSAGTSKS